MSKDRWQRIVELFDEGVGCPREEVETFLRQACGEDRQLALAVGALIDADREAGDFLDDPALGNSVREASSFALRDPKEPVDD